MGIVTHTLEDRQWLQEFGVVLAVFLSKVDYRIYRKFKWIIYVVIVALLFLVGLTGMSAGGATRWINIGGFNFQPSEVAKLAFILFLKSCFIIY